MDNSTSSATTASTTSVLGNWTTISSALGSTTGYANTTVQVVQGPPPRRTHGNVRIVQGSIADIPEEYSPCCVVLFMNPPKIGDKMVNGILTTRPNIKPVGILKKLMRNFLGGRIRAKGPWDHTTYKSIKRHIYEIVVWGGITDDTNRLRFYLIHNDNGTTDDISKMDEETYANIVWKVPCSITLRCVIPVPPHMDAQKLSEELYIACQRNSSNPYITTLLTSKPLKS